jgi:hypothetical protein
MALAALHDEIDAADDLGLAERLQDIPQLEYRLAGNGARHGHCCVRGGPVAHAVAS